ncbi:MAG: hypothetical protein NTX65_13185 [Ignavibacteriales bacterium]|nr:hypothetical protein [Ignavibacteriales bacterium]
MQKLKRFEKRYRAFNKMKILLSMLVIFILISCKGTEPRVNKAQGYFNVDSIHTDYLFSFSEDSESPYGTSSGYRNLKGEIIIPIGKYNHCFTDTFKNFAFVFDDKLTHSKVVAIDRNENILFDVYMFDNGPDELANGLFRIIRNGKIGYADKNGIIVIEPKFECADKFEHDKASVALKCRLVKDESDPEHSRMESDSWFYIDKKGNKVK